VFQKPCHLCHLEISLNTFINRLPVDTINPSQTCDVVFFSPISPILHVCDTVSFCLPWIICIPCPCLDYHMFSSIISMWFSKILDLLDFSLQKISLHLPRAWMASFSLGCKNPGIPIEQSSDRLFHTNFALNLYASLFQHCLGNL
jgi:hypothetical protein